MEIKSSDSGDQDLKSGGLRDAFFAIFKQHKTILLAILITYVALVYYNNASSESLDPGLFIRYILLFFICAFLLVLPLWITHTVFSRPEGRLSRQETQNYLLSILVFSGVLVFIGWCGNSTLINTLLAPFICPAGYEGSEVGFFAKPDFSPSGWGNLPFFPKNSVPFCSGDLGSHTLFLPNDAFPQFFVGLTVFLLISICLIIAAWCMKRFGMKSVVMAAAITTILYLSILGIFAYNHLRIRPYVKPVNNFANKRFYGRFMVNEALYGNTDRIKRVLDAGVNPNLKNYLGWTPMVSAALSGHVDVIHLFLDYGADPSITDSRLGKSPLDYALEHAENGDTGFAELVKRLERESAARKN